MIGGIAILGLGGAGTFAALSYWEERSAAEATVGPRRGVPFDGAGEGADVEPGAEPRDDSASGQASPDEPTRADPATNGDPATPSGTPTDDANGDPATDDAETFEIDPRRSVNALVTEGEGLVLRGEMAHAGAIFEHVLERAPNDNHALAGMAMVLVSRGEGERSVTLAERAVQLRSRRVPYRIVLGEAYLLVGRTDDAREQFTRVVQLDPGNSTALRHLRELASAPGP
jgi:hypothetical protein